MMRDSATTRFESWLSQTGREISGTSLKPTAGTGGRERLVASTKSILVLASLITGALITGRHPDGGGDDHAAHVE